AQGPLWFGYAMVIGGDQKLSCLLGWYAAEDGIEGEQRVVGKVHLRHQTRERRRAEQREMDVGRSPGVRVIEPGIGSRTNRQEAIDAILIGQTATHAQEVGIERSGPLITLVPVAASSIGLPDLQEGVGQGCSTIV